MGLCLSKLSSELPHSDSLNGGHESRAIFSDQRNSTNTHTQPHALFSLYSRRGTRPLNQDSTVLCQGFGMTEATVCAVFDGHGPNGHVVSELVRNRLPLILLNQRVVVNESSPVKMENIEFKLVPPNFDMDPKIWNEAITSSFKVLDAELGIPHKFDFSCSGTTAVVAIAQVHIYGFMYVCKKIINIYINELERYAKILMGCLVWDKVNMRMRI
ncbi:probable protein phosphatase 2C 72 [Humulus lupulus]|uniref:probable protein phosphatase 2C 72 n=1 Tax=Humulus lupulus TaxID=3486 RepID=UPI002B4151A3|nr:probable protein phosphatase 2C 72 [Humulus lupulus]